MGGTITKTNFEWTYTGEPHETRRKVMLAKYPQIKKLFGPDPIIVLPITFSVVVQTLISYWMYKYDVSWIYLTFVAWIVGGTFNNSLQLVLHELSHNLAFGNQRLWANRFLSFFANLPLGVPAASTFKKYHIDHHRYLGFDGLDVDVPSDFECLFFHYEFTKLFWLLLQPLFYALRPMFVNPQILNREEIINWTIQLSYDVIILQLFGVKGLSYLILSSLIGMGFHPMAGHFISEHYTFKEGFETYSYYGILNYLGYNVGYHNEHHDFPYIACRKLPQLKAIAPEYYDPLPCYTSWVFVLWIFLTDKTIGPCSRVKRHARTDKKLDMETVLPDIEYSYTPMWKLVAEDALLLFPNQYYRTKNGEIYKKVS
ncbi:hypothetical protein SNEBB_008184 [Seison nebaliae]|nr:hypothetical protein SNEBB_008184 [Seison nebaliae]